MRHCSLLVQGIFRRTPTSIRFYSQSVLFVRPPNPHLSSTCSRTLQCRCLSTTHNMASSDRDVLPAHVKPVHYDLSVFDIELGGEFSYKGRVKIDFKLKEPTNNIVLNTFQLKLESAKVLDSKGTAHEAGDIEYDAKAQRADIQFPNGKIESDGTLDIAFTGTVNADMAGFYRSRYKPASTPVPSVPQVGEWHYMFSTQFESCDARRAFPCFDEPNLKSTFDLQIEIPEDQTALSNMPEKETKKAEKEGRKVVAFERTPIMSTYLLAWAVGDFTYVEAHTERQYNGKNLPVRVYTTRGLEKQGQYALDHAHKIVDWFSEIFEIDYPLPKSDLLAVHEFSHGAMENWGLVTYRTSAVLFDEKDTDEKMKKRIAYVVAHELAHQWFGNLVTMDWWSELWLNEGFATWVGWLATDHLHPDWNVWAEFVADGMQTSLDLDSLRSSHPIEVPVSNALAIDQIFDAISYLKGSSMIRMLSNHLGVSVFLKGVAAYLKKHAYGNATTNDLWAGLSEASGKDVNSFMDNWIRVIGYPVLTVAEEPGQITVRQSRFLSTGDVRPDEDKTLWWVPLALKTGADATKASSTALYAKEDTIRDVDETFYKINSDSIGFYRTNYPPERLAKLGEARAKLSIQDRIALIGDADALAQAGAGTAAGLLNLCAEFRDETEFLVWSQLLGSLGTLRSVFSHNEQIQAGLAKFILHLITPMVEKVGWDAQANESMRDGQLRALILSTAGGVGHQATIDEALRRFEAAKGGDTSAIPPNIRLATFRTAVRHGGSAPYEHLKTLAATGETAMREHALAALGRVQTAELARDLLEFNLTDAVPIQDAHTASSSLGANSKARPVSWEWLKANWDRVHARFSGNSVVLARYVRLSLNKFADHEVERDIAAFFKERDTEGFDKILAQVADAIKRNANYRERDEKLIVEWLQTKNYTG